MTTEMDSTPAFPVTAGHRVWSEGMTLRDWFAGQALASIAEMHAGMPIDQNATAKSAYRFADAMLKAREDGQ